MEQTPNYPLINFRRYASAVIQGYQLPCAVSDQLFIYIPIRGVCEIIGVKEEMELARIASEELLREGMVNGPFNVRQPGGRFQTEVFPCINLTRLHTWLWLIPAEQVAPDTREALRIFKHQAADILYAYFGRPMLPPDLKAEEDPYLTEEQRSHFTNLEEQYHADHPVINDDSGQPPANGLTIAFSSEEEWVEFIDQDQMEVYKTMLGLVGKVVEDHKPRSEKRRGWQIVESGLKKDIPFSYYWVITPAQWPAVVNHLIQTYQSVMGRGAILPPIFKDALKMRSKPRKLDDDQQPAMF